MLNTFLQLSYAGFFAKSQIMFFLLSSFRFLPPLKNDGIGDASFNGITFLPVIYSMPDSSLLITICFLIFHFFMHAYHRSRMTARDVIVKKLIEQDAKKEAEITELKLLIKELKNKIK